MMESPGAGSGLTGHEAFKVSSMAIEQHSYTEVLVRQTKVGAQITWTQQTFSIGHHGIPARRRAVR
jgi:hypothetical protein